MIVLTSHRPHAEANVEWTTNQIRAVHSWRSLANEIIYVGPREPALAGHNTRFIDGEPFPRIKDMAKVASRLMGCVCVVNADIVLGMGIRTVCRELMNGNAAWATSRRHVFDPSAGVKSATLELNDRGRDIWMAHPRYWREVAEEVPDFYRMGHQQWDKWMWDFMVKRYTTRWIEMTPMKFVFHPRHEGRKMPYADEIIQKAEQEHDPRTMEAEQAVGDMGKQALP